MKGGEPQPPSSRQEPVAGIILAAGTSSRFGGDKMWVGLCGQALVAWSIAAFARCDAIDDLVLVVVSESVDRARQLLDEMGVDATVAVGGERRQDSVRAGLGAAAGAEWVVVHDGARPLVSPDLVIRGLEAARATGAAIPAVPVVDTIKIVEGERVVATPDRRALWAAQTPQVFRRSLLVEAHHRGSSTGTDDAALVEALGIDVRIYPGSASNIKVTRSADLRMAEALLVACEAAP